jgi:hypothetical protein
MLPDKPLPQLSIDPFSDESLADPYAHHDLLRGAGHVFWLECHGIYGAPRHAEVSAALKDWQPTLSLRNILGFEDSCLMLARGPTARPCCGSTRTRLLRPSSSSSYGAIGSFPAPSSGGIQRRGTRGVIDRPEDINSWSSCRFFD